MNSQEFTEFLNRDALGRIAGRILLTALEEDINLQKTMTLIEHRAAAAVGIKKPVTGLLGLEEAWRENHSVAHMWAAKVENNGFAGDAVGLLRRAEELLDLMQARPDLAHPDPWRCSPELRRKLGLPK